MFGLVVALRCKDPWGNLMAHTLSTSFTYRHLQPTRSDLVRPAQHGRWHSIFFPNPTSRPPACHFSCYGPTAFHSFSGFHLYTGGPQGCRAGVMPWSECRVYALWTFLSRAQLSAPLRRFSPVLSCCFCCPSSQRSGYIVLTLGVTPCVHGKGRRSQDGKHLQAGLFVGKTRLKLRCGHLRSPHPHKHGHCHYKYI